jgi:hypothetical protein
MENTARALRRTALVPVKAAATFHVNVYRMEFAAMGMVKHTSHILRPLNTEEPLPACAWPAAAAVCMRDRDQESACERVGEREEYPARAPLEERWKKYYNSKTKKSN